MPSIKPKTILDAVKTARRKGLLPDSPMAWVGYSPTAMMAALARISPYLLIVYDTLFMEVRGQLVCVTAVSDDAVRIQLIGGEKCDYEWLQVSTLPTKFMIKQKPPYL
jgi:hypothetical protein